ncbi:MAG: metal ABC transporter permease [Chloroflexota bacterium]
MENLFAYSFMVRALAGAGLVGLTAPVLGLFLVLRRFSLIADTLSHVALMGVAIGVVTGIQPTLATFAAVTAGAVVIEMLRARGRLPGDVVLAVVLYSTLAVAVTVISTARGFSVDLLAFLFGNVLSITAAEVAWLGVLAALVLLAVGAFFTELAQSAFDEDLARASGVRVGLVNLGLAVLTGAAITLSVRVVGVLLVGALMVVPVLAGGLLARSLRGALATGMGLGVAAAGAGITLAFYADLPAGAAIVLCAVALLLIAALVAGARRTRRA